MCALVLAACTAVATAQEQAPLRAIWFEWDPCFAFRDTWAEAYFQETGNRVEVTCVPIGIWESTMFDDFAKGADGVYDLHILDSQFIGKAYQNGYIRDLTSFVAKEVELNDYYEDAFSAYSEYPPNSKQYWGMPFFADVNLLFFRKDIWSAHGFDDPFDHLDLLDISRQLYDATGMGFSAPWCADAARCYDQAAGIVNERMLSFGGQIWNSKTFQIDGVLQSDANVEALDYSRELSQLSPSKATECDFDCAVADFCSGRSHALEIWAGFGPGFLSTDSCAVADNIGFSVVPGQRTHALSLGGMGVHIASQVSEERQQRALSFVRWQMTREQQREWTRMGGYTSRKSVLATGLFLNSAPYAPAFAVSYPLVQDFYRLPEFSELLAIEMHYLGEALDGRMSSADALDAMAREQQAIIDEAYPNGPPEPPRDRVDINSAVLIAVLVIAGLLMGVTVAVGVFVWVKRRVAVFRFASPSFMLLTLFGVLVMLSSLFSYAQDPPTTGSCQVHLWFSVVGVCLIFSPLLAKTYRVFALWRDASKFRTRRITSLDVLQFVALVTLPIVILLAVWTGVDINEPRRDVDALEDDEYIVKCDNDNLGIYLGVLFGYLGLFLITGLIFSFLARKVGSHFNESKAIAATLANLFLVSCICLPLIFFISEDPTVTFVLEAIGLLATAALILILIFGTKIYTYLTGKGNTSNIMGASGTTSGSTRLASMSTSGTPTSGSGSGTGEYSDPF